MGCVASSIDKEERVRICKERKRLVKRLLGLRREFADSQLAYLRALKNTGVTLRQFTESESLEPDDPASGHLLPPSPPLPLPPSPPPPPTFSPDLRGPQKKHLLKTSEEDIIDIDDDDSQTPPPPPVLSTSWEYWDPFGSSLSECEQKIEIGEQVEEENWAETKSEFEEEDEEEEEIPAVDVVNVPPVKQQIVDLVDDNSSTMSWNTKDAADMAMVVWRSKKTLAGIVRELDEYFVNLSAGVKDVAVFLDVNEGDTFLYHSIKANKSRKSNSAKVFSALTWNWSSKSLHSSKDIGGLYSPSEPCQPGAHCMTLEKLYTAEQKLYKEVKEEEIAKSEHQRRSLMLQKLVEEDHDWVKTEKTRAVVETLQSDIFSLQESIGLTCSTISKLIDEELQPQLIALTSGLMCMWRRMYESHQVQNHIAQQLNHLANQHSVDSTTAYRQQAAAQLKNEVTSWYNSFFKLVKSQREYVSILSSWIQLSNFLVDAGQQSISASAVHTLSEHWICELDKLPDKASLDAIKSLISAVHSIVLQQDEEVNLHKRSEKLERKLQRELNTLTEMEIKFAGGSSSSSTNNDELSPKHPLSVKRAKIEALKKQVDDEKEKYANSINVTRAMILNNLQTSLPNVFCALMEFSSAYSQSLEALLSCGSQVEQGNLP
ncbi:hypothetical protein M9H77_11419 [Catharanthus roseus]|uniref:Uncharacterized protein n=1 Tax=Catharanthus roseus TaxID=4058 RepID=A0ACC0BEK2_CATRO|nr:hypothetical protein M9H77_11419 [Catharanthus roseus]